MGFRARPPGVVEGPIGAGTLDLPDACARAKRLATRPFKFTLTGPHMLAKTLRRPALQVDRRTSRWRWPTCSPRR